MFSVAPRGNARTPPAVHHAARPGDVLPVPTVTAPLPPRVPLDRLICPLIVTGSLTTIAVPLKLTVPELAKCSPAGFACEVVGVVETEKPEWWRRRANWRSKSRCMPGRTGGRSARAAVVRDRVTTGCRSGGSSSCLCGESPCIFVYAMRRVDCRSCGVTVERVPWAEGKCHLTTSYRWFLARWAKRLSWEEVATIFHTTWRNVFRVGKTRGFLGRGPSGTWARSRPSAWMRSSGSGGISYLTLVYQIEEGMKRLLWVAQERTEDSLRRFFRMSQRASVRSRSVLSVATCGSPT